MLKKILACAAIGVLLPAISYGSGEIGFSDHDFKSGPYIGIQGNYVLVFDDAEFAASNPSNPNFLPEDQTNDQSTYGGGVYIGYGYFFDHGNLPYLGAELGFNVRADYNKNPTLDDGSLYGRTINSNGDLSFDILPGFFLDANHKTLLYGRLGVECDQFKFDSAVGDDDTKYSPLFRAGIGVEHEIVNNFYLRLDYVFAIQPSDVSFEPLEPNFDDTYSSQTMFNTFSIGLTYRF